MKKSEIFEYPDGLLLPPVHPGLTLAAELAAQGLTADALALKLGIQVERLLDIVNGHSAISPETALRLGQYFGTSARFWMNLQTAYDLAIVRQTA